MSVPVIGACLLGGLCTVSLGAGRNQFLTSLMPSPALVPAENEDDADSDEASVASDATTLEREGDSEDVTL